MEDWQRVLRALNNHFTSATGEVSKLSRTWALAVVFPAYAWLIKGDCASREMLYAIICLSLFSLIVDGTQSIYVALRAKSLSDKVGDNIDYPSECITCETKRTRNVAFILVVLKFFVLVLTTFLLGIYLFILS